MSGMMALLGADPLNITENPHAHHQLHDHAAMMAAAASSATPVDHSGHQHDNHDSAQAMDHSAHSMEGHSMSMWFHGGVDEVVLFSCWNISSVTGMSISFIGIFILAVLYEGLKCFREYLTKRACYCSGRAGSAEELNHRCPPQCCENRNPNGTSAPLTRNDSTPNELNDDEVRVVNQSSRFNGPPLHWLHFVQTGLHIVQIVVSYFLMLVFMTYNVWLCLAVALGAGVGYFLFGWRRGGGGMDLNEHCN